jgi:putative ABC transport system permease protein
VSGSRLAVRSAWAHRGSFALGALAIVISVAFAVASILMVGQLSGILGGKGARIVPTADAIVAAQGPSGFTEEALAAVSESGGVAAVLPMTRQSVALLDAEGVTTELRPAAYIVDPSEGFRPSGLTGGRLPRTATEVVLDSVTAREAGLAIGDEVRVAGADRSSGAFSLVGITDPALAPDDDDAVAGFTPEGALPLLRDRAAAGFAVRAAPDAVGAQLRAALPGTLAALGYPADEVRVLDEYEARQGQSATSASVAQYVGVGLMFFVGIALLGGIFVIANSFAVLIAGRTKEIALLRAVGIRRGQVFSAVLLEGAMVGVVASCVGVLVGIGAAWALAHVLLGFAALSGASVAAACVVGVAMGTGVAVVAMTLPARKATRVPPVAALADAEVVEAEQVGRWRLWLGAGVLILGLMMMVLGFTGVLFGSVVALAGVLIMAPILMPAIGRLLVLPFRSVVGRAASRNVARHPRRAARTAAVVLVGAALVGGMASVVSTSNSLLSVAASHEAIFIVAPSLPPELDEELAAVPGTTRMQVLGNTDAAVEVLPGFDRQRVEGGVAQVLSGFPGAAITDRDSAAESVMGPLQRIAWGIGGLAALSMVVGLVGVVNTVLLGLGERTREMAVLRAVGMSRRRLAGSVMLEAGLMATAGLTVGLALGATAAQALFFGLGADPFIDLRLMGAILAVGVSAVVAAAWLPARRAASISPALALAA